MRQFLRKYELLGKKEQNSLSMAWRVGRGIKKKGSGVTDETITCREGEDVVKNRDRFSAPIQSSEREVQTFIAIEKMSLGNELSSVGGSTPRKKQGRTPLRMTPHK